jgi:hypothetical protein
MKKLVAFGLLLSLNAGAAYSACWVEGAASIRNRPDLNPAPLSGPQAATSEVTWNEVEGNNYSGSELRSSYAQGSGSDLVYSGPARDGFMLAGADIDVDGSMTGVKPHINFSTDWQPDQREVCTKHKTVFGKGRKCVEKGLESYPTSFIVDVTTNYGQQVHYQARFDNINSISNAIIDLPLLVCEGSISKYEVRIHGVTGGNLTFNIHGVRYDRYIKY